MKTIEIKESVELAFSYRKDADVPKENALEVKVVADLSKLSAEDVLEWAYSAMIVAYQTRLRSKTPPVLKETEVEAANEDGSVRVDVEGNPVMVKVTATAYEWVVPSRGSRSTADPKKVSGAADKLVGKMTEGEKQHHVYNILISMGRSETEARAVSGFTGTI